MTIKLKTILLHGLIASLMLFMAQLAMGQSMEKSLLDQRFRQLEIKDSHVNLVLLTIADKHHIPIGFEAALGGREPSEIKINVRNKTVREVLNKIVEQDPRYRWEFINGVINVYPKENRDTFLKDILDTRIQQFTIDKRASKFHVRNTLTESREIKAKLEKAEITPAIVAFTSIDFDFLGDEFSLRMSDSTMREILNEIIRTSETQYWYVGRFGDDNQFLVLNF